MDEEICRVKIKFEPGVNLKACIENLYSENKIDYYAVLMYEPRSVDMQLKKSNLQNVLNLDKIEGEPEVYYPKI